MSLQGQMGAHVQRDNYVSVCAHTCPGVLMARSEGPGCSECGLHGCRWSQGVFPDFPVGWMSAVCSEEPLESFIHSTNIYWTDVLIFLLWGFPFLGLPYGSCPPLPSGERGSVALKEAPCEVSLPYRACPADLEFCCALGMGFYRGSPCSFLPSPCLDFGSESLG